MQSMFQRTLMCWVINRYGGKRGSFGKHWGAYQNKQGLWEALVTLHLSAEPEMGDGRKEVMLSLLTLKEIENTEKQIL